jgi:sugar phosphate isomerase/epimerase
MQAFPSFTRRSFLAASVAASLASTLRGAVDVPIGLELYSVRDELKHDQIKTVRTVAKMGYQCVEFYAPYYDWTVDYAKEMKKVMDDIGIHCYSTHNGPKSFTAEGMPHAIELNNTLGAKYVVFASAGKPEGGLDGWKRVAETLNHAAEQLKPAGLQPGYHNHQLEFTPVDGKRPMDVLAAETGKDVMLQFDVGTCVEVGADPVAWINQNPGRIRSMHLKDWAPGEGKGYRVLFGEGICPWKAIFEAATKTGGLEYALIEQEGSNYPALETAYKCLQNYRKMML